MSCRKYREGRAAAWELSQYRKLDPKLNTDIVIMIAAPKNRKVLVTHSEVYLLTPPSAQNSPLTLLPFS